MTSARVQPVDLLPPVERLELWIPRPPDNANARQHWAEAVRVKRRYLDELWKRQMFGQLPRAPEEPWPAATLATRWFVAKRHRLLDQDNAVRRLKPVIDWLVGAELLAGDAAHQLLVLPPEQTRDPIPATAPPLTSVRLTLTLGLLAIAAVGMTVMPRTAEVAP